MEQVISEDVPDKISHFEDACERLTEAAMECVLNLADEHENLSEIVTMLIPYKNVDNIKKTVLKLLTVTSKSQPIWTMKAALDLLKSTNMEDDNAEDILNLIVSGSAYSLEEAFSDPDPLTFIDMVPNTESDLEETFLQLFQMWKNNICRNCRSIECKNGMNIPSKVLNQPYVSKIKGRETISQVKKYYCYKVSKWNESPEKVWVYCCKLEVPTDQNLPMTAITKCSCGCVEPNEESGTLLKKIVKKL